MDQHCSFPPNQTLTAKSSPLQFVCEPVESFKQNIFSKKPPNFLSLILKFSLSLFFQAQISPYSYYYKVQDPAPAKPEERVELHTEQKVNHKPRVCKMVKGPSGFGFNLNMVKNKPGLFINEVLT